MIVPYKDDSSSKVEQIKKMFDRIAPNYDNLNRIISLGLDGRWRKRGIDMLASFGPKEVLDVATGTGDLAIELLQHIPSIEHIIGADISHEMMRVGANKIASLGLEKQVRFDYQDCTRLSYPNDSFDAVTIAFGIRNFPDIPQAIKEIYRVLRANQPALIIELSEPTNPLLKLGYNLYTKRIIPIIGGLLSTDKAAYQYLPKSIGAVPQREKMTSLLREAGFSHHHYYSIFPGTCTIYLGIK